VWPRGRQRGRSREKGTAGGEKEKPTALTAYRTAASVPPPPHPPPPPPLYTQLWITDNPLKKFQHEFRPVKLYRVQWFTEGPKRKRKKIKKWPLLVGRPINKYPPAYW
jgi:hypothetical protein